MNLALIGFFDLPHRVSPKSFSFKGFPMLKNLNFRERLLAAGVAVTAVASQASAALAAPTLDTADFTTVAGAVIVALGAMWAIKKALGLIRV